MASSGRAGAPTWEPAWSSAHQRWFYQDRKTGASSWTRPQGCHLELPREPPADGRGAAASATEGLPPGWESEWDAKHRMTYYFNRTTRERVWKKPQGAAEPMGASAGSRAQPECRASQQSPGVAAEPRGMPDSASGPSRRPWPAALHAEVRQAPEASPGACRPAAASRPMSAERWDAAAFLDRLARAKATGDPDAVKAVRKEVAEHNYVIRNTWLVPRTLYIAADSVLKARAGIVPSSGRCPEISFSEATTADAVQMLTLGPSKRRVCALNFANGIKVGGGYKTGAVAQEEDLCRRIPGLFTSLNNAKRDGHYPFGPCTCSSPSRPEKYSDVLWTPNVLVARANEAQGYALLPSEWQAPVSLVAAAAPNVRFASPRDIKDVHLMYNTVKTIFIVPRMFDNEITTIVLGAWGCGAFGGDPREVSELFCRALKDGLGSPYREVHFAIPKSGPEDMHADIFREALRRHGFQSKDVQVERSP